MNPLRITGYTRELAKDQPEYTPLCIRDTVLNGQAAMLSAWEPDPREVEYLKDGGALYVGVQLSSGDTQPAMMRAPDPDELEKLVNGGSVIMGLVGTSFPPVFVIVTTPEEARTCTPVEKTFAFVLAQPAPTL